MLEHCLGDAWGIAGAMLEQCSKHRLRGGLCVNSTELPTRPFVPPRALFDQNPARVLRMRPRSQHEDIGD
jgi:hypothetical protein